MQLKLDPPSSSSLPPDSASVTQHLRVVNTMQGSKPLAMRLRVTYTLGGQQVAEQGEVSNFPVGW